MNTVICVASGPSLTDEQCALADEARRDGRCKVIVVNDNFRKIPDADALYACDGAWWRLYAEDVRARFRGECWTHKPLLDRIPRNIVEVEHAETLVRYPWLNAADLGRIGGNSGAQAIELARLRFNAERVLLIGYDMQCTNDRAHWFGDHPKPLTQGVPTAWIRWFVELAPGWAARGISVINCTISTALTCFPRADLRDALA